MDERRFTTFKEFWPFYLSQHANVWTRRLHLTGVVVALAILFIAIERGQPLLVLAAIGSGYFFAWLGHFFVEKNRPATFQYPLYSLMGDFKMVWHIITRQKN